MTGNVVIELDGKTYRVEFSVVRAARSARENGQPMWPDEPDHIDDLQVWGLREAREVVEVPVEDEKTVNRIYEFITREYLEG
jgi:hypothetical protein